MKSLNSILFLYLSTFFSCGFNGLQDLKEIDHIINKSVENEHPGLGVGIVKNGEVIYEKYRGLSNLQHQIPFSKKTTKQPTHQTHITHKKKPHGCL